MSFQYPGGSESPEQAAPERPSSAPEIPQPAFVDLHGRSLHGFSLLLCLGDEPAAGQLTADALARGLEHPDELGHPERAAAWLRGSVYRDYVPTDADAGIPDTLHRIGVTPAAAAGLAALSGKERAALIAGDIERLDRRDAATVIGAGGREFSRVIARARRRYVEAFVAASADAPVADGPIVRHLRGEAARLLA
jgi:DNA-directed RNA polymerase specialized sigma24 family protein